jgi:hypothetical protein
LNGAKPPQAGYTGQAYGTASAQAAATAAVPVSAPGVAVGDPMAGLPPDMPAPGSLGALNRPTENDRPVTHGLPSGPGAGPEVLNSGQEQWLDQLKALYLKSGGNSDLRALIEYAEGRAQ